MITQEIIDVSKVISEASDRAPKICGAQVLFVGIVREHNLGKKVVSVSYDAHPQFAAKIITEISEEARQKYGPHVYVEAVHRVGDLQVGDASIAIVVHSKHRDEGYLASRYVLEEIKTRAPIWKKEKYEDGETEWLKGHALCGHAQRQQNKEMGSTACGGSLHSHGHG